MIERHCIVKHSPPETYGDCVRACIASLMNLEPYRVPHFADKGVSGEEMIAAMRAWLADRWLVPFIGHFDGEATFAEILEQQAEVNPGCYYMVFGSNGEGDHVVICRDGKVAHDPAWYRTPLVGPGSTGVWIVMVLAAL